MQTRAGRDFQRAGNFLGTAWLDDHLRNDAIDRVLRYGGAHVLSADEGSQIAPRGFGSGDGYFR
jgi:hypothetical protein